MAVIETPPLALRPSKLAARLRAFARGAIVCGIAAAAIAIYARHLQPPSLLDASTKIIPHVTWEERVPVVWLSKTELIYPRKFGKDSSALAAFDIDSRRERILFSPIPYHSDTFSTNGLWAALSVSPDRNRLMWSFDWQGAHAPDGYDCQKLDGVIERKWDAQLDYGNEIAWFPDNRRFAVIEHDLNQSAIVVRDIREPRPIATVRLDPDAGMVPYNSLNLENDENGGMRSSGTSVLVRSRLLGIVSDDRALIMLHSGYVEKSKVTLRYQPLHAGAKSTDVAVTVPEGARLCTDSVLSPDQTRIAYLFYGTRKPAPFLRRLGEYIPILRREPYDFFGIWVGRAGEHGLKCIGEMPDPATHGSGPTNLLWTPDGKHISYELNGSLWSVQAD